MAFTWRQLHLRLVAGTGLKRPWGFESQPAQVTKLNNSKGCSHSGFSKGFLRFYMEHHVLLMRLSKLPSQYRHKQWVEKEKSTSYCSFTLVNSLWRYMSSPKLRHDFIHHNKSAVPGHESRVRRAASAVLPATPNRGCSPSTKIQWDEWLIKTKILSWLN